MLHTDRHQGYLTNSQHSIVASVESTGKSMPDESVTRYHETSHPVTVLSDACEVQGTGGAPNHPTGSHVAVQQQRVLLVISQQEYAVAKPPGPPCSVVTSDVVWVILHTVSRRQRIAAALALTLEPLHAVQCPGRLGCLTKCCLTHF